MKVIVPRQELVLLTSKIQNLVSLRPPLPILANILLEAQDDQLTLSATDLTVSMRCYMPAKVVEEGAITLPGRRLFQLLREITAPQIEIHTTSPEVAEICAAASHFKIQGMHKTEFPALPDLSGGLKLTLPAQTLKEMFGRTSFAAARDESRQALAGILFQWKDGEAICIATDGKRLAKVHVEVGKKAPQQGAYIFPLKAVEEIVRMIDSDEEEVKLTLLPERIAIEYGKTLIMTKLLVGPYPDVSRVIPTMDKAPIALHREELMALLRQVSLFTAEGSHAVRFTFTSGTLHLSAESSDVGTGVVSMPVNYGGEKLEIAFNPHYFLDILRHTHDETVDLRLTDSYNPGLVTDSSKATFVLMPMRLES